MDVTPDLIFLWLSESHSGLTWRFSKLTTFTPIRLTNWPMNDKEKSNLNWRQFFPCHNIHVFYIHSNYLPLFTIYTKIIFSEPYRLQVSLILLGYPVTNKSKHYLSSKVWKKKQMKSCLRNSFQNKKRDFYARQWPWRETPIFSLSVNV